MEWFENVVRYVNLEPRQFAYALLTGSQRIGHANLKLRDPDFVHKYEGWLAERSGYGRDGQTADVSSLCDRRHATRESRGCLAMGAVQSR